MVFQSPHGRLYFSLMLLDRDIDNFNYVLSIVYYSLLYATTLQHYNGKTLFYSKAHAWYEFKT